MYLNYIIIILFFIFIFIFFNKKEFFNCIDYSKFSINPKLILEKKKYFNPKPF